MTDLSKSEQCKIPVEVTQEMVRAGLLELREVDRSDDAYFVTSIYMAMEFQRLDMLGKL